VDLGCTLLFGYGHLDEATLASAVARIDDFLARERSGQYVLTRFSALGAARDRFSLRYCPFRLPRF
jgi:hypothetical protein